MTIDYHRTPMIQFRPDAELYAAIEAHQRPGESLNQTAKRLLIASLSSRVVVVPPAPPTDEEIERFLTARLAQPPRAESIPVGHGRNTRRAESG